MPLPEKQGQCILSPEYAPACKAHETPRELRSVFLRWATWRSFAKSSGLIGTSAGKEAAADCPLGKARADSADIT